MPVIHPSPPPPPEYHSAPADVQTYLYSRGWTLAGNSNLWEHSGKSELWGHDFQWPEALAYEIFQNFVMLKTGEE